MRSDFDSRSGVIKLRRSRGARTGPHLICSPLVSARKRRRSERYKSLCPAASFLLHHQESRKRLDFSISLPFSFLKLYRYYAPVI